MKLRIAPYLLLLISDAALAQSGLLDGVREIGFPGVPGSLALFSRAAQPVALGHEEGKVMSAVVATSRLGKGRILAFGHDGYFNPETIKVGDTGKLLVNAVGYCSNAKPNPRVGVVGLEGLLAYYRSQGVNAVPANLNADLSSYDVLVFIHNAVTPQSIRPVTEFIRAGGGLIGASTGWGWVSITGQSIAQHPMNQITAEAGIGWSSGMVNKRGNRAGLFISTETPKFLNASEAARAMLTGANMSRDESAQAVSSILSAATCVPESETSFRAELSRVKAVAGEAAVPTKRRPVALSDALPRLALALSTDEAGRVPIDKLTAHPAGAVFPGSSPAGTPTVVKTVRLDTRIPGWHSTGLYADPGARITVTLAGRRGAGRLTARIGCHTDELWHLQAWERAPRISRTFALKEGANLIGNAFGGLIYIESDGRGDGTPLEVRVEGGVASPYFKLGETSVAEWKRTVRELPGPWAEIAGTRVIFTLPSSYIRSLENPETLMKLWDQLLTSQEKLVAAPYRPRLERIVADQQISAGYMHSGYPIMAPIDDSTSAAMDEARLRREGTWGHLHELGHNLQEREWTFEGTGEVTNNVMVLYAFEKVLGLPFDSGHPAIKVRDQRMSRVKKYIDSGSNFETWKGDPFLALTMYIQLREGFGWEPFEKAFAEYRALPNAERPRREEDRRDQWMIRMSRATGKNLSRFFETWGVPISSTAKESVRDLPTWNPTH